MGQITLVKRTQNYFLLQYGLELSDDETRNAMIRLVRHFQWLAKWHSEDEKHPPSSALTAWRGECEDAC